MDENASPQLSDRNRKKREAAATSRASKCERMGEQAYLEEESDKEKERR